MERKIVDGGRLAPGSVDVDLARRRRTCRSTRSASLRMFSSSEGAYAALLVNTGSSRRRYLVCSGPVEPERDRLAVAAEGTCWRSRRRGCGSTVRMSSILQERDGAVRRCCRTTGHSAARCDVHGLGRRCWRGRSLPASPANAIPCCAKPAACFVQRSRGRRSATTHPRVSARRSRRLPLYGPAVRGLYADGRGRTAGTSATKRSGTCMAAKCARRGVAGSSG